MPEGSDVIVIGAGVIGCAIAYELARRGAHVRVFEARAIGGGATQASAGVLAPYIESPAPGPFLDLCIRGLHEYETFVASVRRDSEMDLEFRICGTLEVAADDEAAERLRLDPHGPAVWLEPDEVRRREPTLPESNCGAAFVAQHGYVTAERLTEALAWAALRAGADLEAGRRIIGVEPDGSGVGLRDGEGGAWVAGHVVVAAGSWAGQVGIDDPAASAVKPVRGQLVRLTWSGEPPRHVIWGPECYVVPWRDGTVLVGATVEDVGFDEQTTAAGVRDLLDAVCELLPAAWKATFRDARAGLRPGTTDDLPLIGPSAAVSGIIYATGHYRNGILLAPVTARLVADLILDNRVDPLLQHFHPSRFSSRGTGTLRHLSP